MTNADRRRLLEEFRASGMEGSILDVFKAYEQGRDIIAEHKAQQQAGEPLRAETPEQQKEGLRPYHQAGQTDQTMVFPDVEPGAVFNTRGMKAPIDIEKVDKSGHIVESYKSIPPGIQQIPTGPYEGDIIESPAQYQKGGDVEDKEEKKQDVSLTWSEKTGFDNNKVPGTRIMTFADGTQMPVLLGTAEVVANKDRQGLDSVEDVLQRTNAGIAGDYSKIDEGEREEYETGVTKDIGEAGKTMMNVATDALSWPARMTTGAFLNVATGNKINTNPFAYTDVARGIEQDNYSPSTTLDLTGGKGMAADMLLDPTIAFGAGRGLLKGMQGLGRFGLQYSKVPFGYNPKEVFGPVKTLQNVLSKKKHVENVANYTGSMRGRRLPYDKLPGHVKTQAQSRIDAIRLALGKDQRFGSYVPTGGARNEYRFAAPEAAEARAKYVRTPGTSNFGFKVEKDGSGLTRDFRRAAEKGIEEGTGTSVGYRDQLHGVMGGYRMETKAKPGGGLKIDMVDDWDLQPFQQKMRFLEKDSPLSKIPKRLRDKIQEFEVFDALGGKPIRIRQSYDLDYVNRVSGPKFGPKQYLPSAEELKQRYIDFLTKEHGMSLEAAKKQAAESGKYQGGKYWEMQAKDYADRIMQSDDMYRGNKISGVRLTNREGEKLRDFTEPKFVRRFSGAFNRRGGMVDRRNKRRKRK
tara:strand:- start:10317 stop:12380 length:2064 start_codon:yes stop_codon:yes gene_type:complete